MFGEAVDVGSDGPRWWVYVRKAGDRPDDFVFARGGTVDVLEDVPYRITAAQGEAAREYLQWRGFTHLLNKNGALVELFGRPRRALS